MAHRANSRPIPFALRNRMREQIQAITFHYQLMHLLIKNTFTVHI